MFATLLDTSVLWPSLQRDFLLSLAAEGLYRPLWSEAILEELGIAQRAKLMQRGTSAVEAQQRVDRLISQMTSAFADAVVTGWEPLEGIYGLPDPNDEHVVAAAVVGGAGAIVTANLKDFPPDRVPGHIEVLGPAVFASNTAHVDPAQAARAVRRMAGRFSDPPQAPDEVLAAIGDRYKMGEVVEILTPYL